MRRVLRINYVLTDCALTGEEYARSPRTLYAAPRAVVRTLHVPFQPRARPFSVRSPRASPIQPFNEPITLYSSLLSEHSQCSVSEKCYPGPFREAINCYVESTLLGSKALLYSSLLHRLAIKLPPRPDFYSDDYLFLALTVNSDQSLCLAIVSYDLPSNPEEFRLHCFVWDNIVLLSLWTWNISLLLSLLLKQLSHTS